MRHYRTEIVIPSDRYVCLQLPEQLPEGQAIVTVFFRQAEASDDEDEGESVVEHHSQPRLEHNDDMEWWDEFDDVLP